MTDIGRSFEFLYSLNSGTGSAFESVFGTNPILPDPRWNSLVMTGRQDYFMRAGKGLSSYKIRNIGSHTLLDLPEETARVGGWEDDSSRAQTWVIYQCDPSQPWSPWIIQSYKYATYLSLDGGNPMDGTKIQCVRKTRNEAYRDPFSQWHLITQQEGAQADVFRIQNATSFTYADLTAGSNDNGVNINGVHYKDNYASQMWLFQPA